MIFDDVIKNAGIENFVFMPFAWVGLYLYEVSRS